MQNKNRKAVRNVAPAKTPNPSCRQMLREWQDDFPRRCMREWSQLIIYGPDGKSVTNQEWVDAESERLMKSLSPGNSHLRNYVAGVISRKVDDWVRNLNRLRKMTAKSESDEQFFRRPAASDEHWAFAEASAAQALAVEAEGCSLIGGEEKRCLWGEREYYRSFWYDSFVGRLHRSGPVLNPVHRSDAPNTSWLRSPNSYWARGVVCHEGAMSAYFRRAGFAISGPPGKFWQQLGWFKYDTGSSIESIKPWRWQLLREAYLAAWVWAFAQMLYSFWSPYEAQCRADLVKAMKSLSAMFDWYWRGKPMKWCDKSVDFFSPSSAIDFDPFFDGPCEDVDETTKRMIGEIISSETAFYPFANWAPRNSGPQQLRYYGKSFAVPAQDSRLIWSAAIPFTLVDRPGCFRQNAAGRWISDPLISQQPFRDFVGNHCLLGLSTKEEYCAFHLLTNLILTPQSRFAALRLGGRFRNWAIAQQLIDSETSMLPLFQHTAHWQDSPSLWR